MADITRSLLDAMNRQISRCTRCGLCRTRTRTVPGHGVVNAIVVFVGEAPGEQEDREGLPFVGRSGQFLKKLLRETGGDPRWCFITNTVKCRPPQNRAPSNEEMTACELWLTGQLAVIKPKIIVCVGQPAARAILGVKKTSKVKELRGRWFEKDGRLVRVIYHPSYLMQHGRGDEEVTRADLGEIWAKARERAGGGDEQSD